MFFKFSIHIAVTKLHTKPGVAEKFVVDLKECVRDIIGREDRQLGKTVSYIFFGEFKINLLIFFIKGCYLLQYPRYSRQKYCS